LNFSLLFRFFDRGKFVFVVLFLLAAICFFIFLNLSMGSMRVPLSAIWQVLFENDASKARTVVWDLRLPRSILAVIIGANLAVAGAVMQCLTRNPLAEPKIMGVSAGAAVAVVCIQFFFINLPHAWFSPVVFAGGAVGGAVVYMLASKEGVSPVHLALAGVAVSAFLHAITVGILILLGQDAGAVYTWLAGGLNGLSWEHLRMILPWSVVGLLMALFLATKMNILDLGEEMARGLGIRIGMIKILLAILTIILAGSAVSISGSIGFIGLIIPHMVRKLFGTNYKIVIPLSALFGGLLLVAADLLARMVLDPIELPVGIFTAAIGCPYFLYLVRKQSD
jgi:iron complex transport system permease protein